MLEILNLVLDIHVKDYKVVGSTVYMNSTNALEANYVGVFGCYLNSENIYEVAALCKEWIKEVDTGSTFVLSGYDEAGLCLLDFGLKSKFGKGKKPFYANSEPEAIFKACEWLLHNRDIK